MLVLARSSTFFFCLGTSDLDFGATRTRRTHCARGAYVLYAEGSVDLSFKLLISGRLGCCMSEAESMLCDRYMSLTALRLGVLASGVVVSACTIFDERLAECTTHVDCTQRLTQEAGSAKPVVGRCIQPQGRCVPLLTDQCTRVTGDPLDEDGILLGSLLTQE